MLTERLRMISISIYTSSYLCCYSKLTKPLKTPFHELYYHLFFKTSPNGCFQLQGNSFSAIASIGTKNRGHLILP